MLCLLPLLRPDRGGLSDKVLSSTDQLAVRRSATGLVMAAVR